MLEISDTFSFEKIKLYSEKLETKYPFLSCCIIGRSFLGRGIFSFSIGNHSNSILITGGTGGKSSSSSLFLYRFLDRVCNSIYSESEISGINFAALTKKFGITVIPCLNPDSAQIASTSLTPEFVGHGYVNNENWNANSVGVDIDLNFDSDWRKEKIDSLKRNIIFAAPEGFPGNSKESEPETRAFTTFCRRRNFRSCMTIRNADKNRLYYKRGEKTPASCTMMAKILASSGVCSICDGEMPACPSRWFLDEFSKPAFLMETKKAPEMIYETLEEMLVLMSVM